MLVTTRSKLVMFLLGWGRFPNYVTADTNLWRMWWQRERKRKK